MQIGTNLGVLQIGVGSGESLFRIGPARRLLMQACGRALRASVFLAGAPAFFMALAICSTAVNAQRGVKTNEKSAQPARSEKNKELPRERMEWFTRQRAFPLGFIPASGRTNALQQKSAMQERQRQMDLITNSLGQPPQSPFNGAWLAIGPQPTHPFGGQLTNSYGNTSGRVTAIAVDPTDSSGATVFIGAAQGGVWKTTNGGATWTPLTDDQPSLAMGALAIAIDPTNSADPAHRVIFAGTGEQAATGIDVYYGAGVIKSLDGGQTWAQTCTGSALANPSCPFTGPFSDGFFPGGGARIGSLVVNPGNPRMLLAGVQVFSGSGLSGQAGQPGVYCTGDAGATWSRIMPSGLTTTAIATSVLYATSSTAYAAIGRFVGDPTNGIYVSHNADQACSAQTWARVAGAGLPAQFRMGQIELTAAPNLVGGQVVLYAGIADVNSNSNSLLGMFRSADGGNTWAQLNSVPDFCSPQCWYDMVVRVDPADATGNTAFFGGSSYGNPAASTLLRTSNGGQTVRDVSAAGDGSILHVNHHAIAFNAAGTRMYAGNDGGLWSSANASLPGTAAGSQTWANLNNGLALTQFYPGFAIHPSSNAVAFGGTQGNGTQSYLGFSSPPWTDTGACADGAYNVVDPNQQSAVYLSCAGAGGARISKSTSSGLPGTFNFLDSSSSILLNDPMDPLPPLVVDPNRTAHLYFGTYRLYESTDGAATWNAVTGDLTSGALANGFAVASIAIAPVSGGAYNIYTGANDGTVEMASNVSAGANPVFTKIMEALPGRTVTRIVADPSDATGKTAYVAFSGFAIDQPIAGGVMDLKGHVFKTTNGGTSWSDVGCHTGDCASPLNTDLPNAPVNDVVIDPDDPAHNTLYVATDVGVFVTADGGADWRELGTGLPNVVVLSLTLHEPSRILRAATHGRSVWDYALPALAGTRSFALGGLNPITASQGAGNIPFVVSGRGFTRNSIVEWNGASVANPVVNVAAQTITVMLPANLLAQGGTAAVTVFDATQNPSATNALSFTISGLSPALTTVSPASVNAGAGDTQIVITGTNLAQNAQVTFNDGTAGVATNSVSAGGTQISATLSHTLLGFGGNATIGVTDPPPGGGPAASELLFTVNNSAAPSNDNFANATVIGTASFSSTVDSFAATSEATDPTPSCIAGRSSNPAGKSVWWKYTAGSVGPVTASTLGSAYDTVLDVVTGGTGNFAGVSCNDDATNSILQSQVTFTTVSGATYYFMVTTFDTGQCPPAGALTSECGGKTIFNFSGPTPAGLAVSPPAATIQSGGSTSYTIGTFGPPLTGAVTFLVAGCPPVSTCSFSPASVTAGSSATLSVSTAANGALLPPPTPQTKPPFQMLAPLHAVWKSGAPGKLCVVIGAMLMALAVLKSSGGKRKLGVCGSAAIFLVLLGGCLAGCNAFTSPPPAPPPPGTTAGQYTLIITATGSANTTATATVTLTVN